MRAVTAATLTVAAALSCCRWSPPSGVRAACLRTADDLQTQARASAVVLKALAMRSWPEPDGTVGGHFAVMAVYKGARAVNDALHVNGVADLYNIRDKLVVFDGVWLFSPSPPFFTPVTTYGLLTGWKFVYSDTETLHFSNTTYNSVMTLRRIGDFFGGVNDNLDWNRKRKKNREYLHYIHIWVTVLSNRTHFVRRVFY